MPKMSRIVRFINKAVVYEVVRHVSYHLLKRDGRPRIAKVSEVENEFYFMFSFLFRGANGHETVDASLVYKTSKDTTVTHGRL